MRSGGRVFFGLSITGRAYSIKGFSLVLMRWVSVYSAFCLPKVLQNQPVLGAILCRAVACRTASPAALPCRFPALPAACRIPAALLGSPAALP